jgi:hypothetical protein
MVGGGCAVLRLVETSQDRFRYVVTGPQRWQFGPFGAMDLKLKSMASVFLECDSGIVCDEPW